MARVAKRYFVDGIVQGVGFRFFVQKKAASLNVAGWARNLEDGRVEVYATGTPEALNDLAAALHIGPRMSDVRSVKEEDAAVEGGGSFTIR